jgi:hypothetical protein
LRSNKSKKQSFKFQETEIDTYLANGGPIGIGAHRSTFDSGFGKTIGRGEAAKGPIPMRVHNSLKREEDKRSKAAPQKATFAHRYMKAHKSDGNEGLVRTRTRRRTEKIFEDDDD